ncbi:hypothetical protein YPPY66_4544, partial [Yersinia pestis PY-66]
MHCLMNALFDEYTI